MKVGTDRLIGRVATYVGDAHPYLDSYPVKVIAVITRPDGDPDAGAVYRNDDDLVGFDPERDIIEVVPWLSDKQRRSWVASDARLEDLKDWRELP